MNHEELTKRRKELIDERAARLEEWRKLIQLEDRPPLAISLIGFILIAAGTVRVYLVEHPSIYEPMFLGGLALMLIGAAVFYNSKITVDGRFKRKQRLRTIVEELNEQIRDASQELGLPNPKIKFPKDHSKRKK